MFCGGSLYELIHKHNYPLGERRRLKMALDVVEILLSLNLQVIAIIIIITTKILF